MELDPEFIELVNGLKTALGNFARAVAEITEMLKPKIEAINAVFNEFSEQYRKSRGFESFEHFAARMDKKERSRRRYYRMQKRNRTR